jgi:hypothetical protein
MAMCAVFVAACGDGGASGTDTVTGADVLPDTGTLDATTEDSLGSDTLTPPDTSPDASTDTDMPPLDAVSDDTVSPPVDTIGGEDVADSGGGDDTVSPPGDTSTPVDVPLDSASDDVVVANAPPTITTAALSDRPVGVAGDAFGLLVEASDPDGDALSYTWRQLDNGAPAGTFTTTNGAAVSWRAPAIAEMTVFAFEVSITDGIHTAVVDTVEVTANVPTFATHIQPIFNAKCTGCHGSSGGLGLGAASAYVNLVNVTGQNAGCNTLKRVLPGDPDNSLLVRKISGTSCGNRMPRNDATHFDNNPGEAIRIRAWILAGAAND